MTTITNSDFADSVGLHFTMASRLRNGERKPGLSTVIATIRAYDLSCDEILDWLSAIERSAHASGQWLQKNIFSRSVEPVAS